MRSIHTLCRTSVFRRWPRLLLAALAIAVALLTGAVGFTRSAHAAGTINVTTTTDEFDTSGTGTGCSLREAIQSANTNANFGGCTGSGGGAPFTINVPAGTYKITLNPGTAEDNNVSGDFDVTSNITFQGAGAASTIIDAQSADRIFDLFPPSPITVVFSGLTLQNGKAFSANFNVGGAIFINSNVTVTVQNSTLANNQSVTSTGGAIENRGALTLNNVTLQNNTAGAPGGAINNIGALTVNGSTFSGNKAESGGALYINTASVRNASITNSTFTGNQAVATAGGASDDGGAIAISTDGTVSITGSTFTGNSAAANGGAIAFTDSATEVAVGTLTMSYNRIVGNTAAAGNGLYRYSGSATAQKNWWGCNAGPAAAPCNVVVGAANFIPWIVLTHTANPSTINGGQTSTLTADFLKNSDGSANAAGSLGALAGVPVSFGSAVLGALSNAQGVIQSNGAATATYTAGGTPGVGSATATVDSATVTANLTISAAPPVITTQPTSQTANAGSTASFSATATGSPTPTVQWQVSTNGGSTWTNIPGATGTTLSFTAQAGDNGKQYRAVFTNTGGTATTNPVLLTVNTPPVITTQPAGQTVSAGSTASFSATATGSPTPTVQWQVSTNGGTTWNNIPGATGTTLSFTAQLSDNGKQYRAVFTNTGGTATTNAATLTVNTPPVITTQPAGQTVNAGATASFSATATGSPTPTAQWQSSTDGGSTWTNIPGATGTTLGFTAQAGDNGNQYRAVFTNAAGTAPTNAATLTVVAENTPPGVTVNRASGQANPTSASPIHFTVVFSKPVTGFGDSAGDVMLSGTAGATTATVTAIAPNDGATYDIAVSGMTASGTVIVSIPAGAAQDATGNGNAASTSTDNTVTFDIGVGPTFTNWLYLPALQK